MSKARVVKSKTAEVKEETKTYILELMPAYGQPARKKVTVPAAWKITYGPAAQGAHVSPGPGGSNPYVLRFYEGQKEHMRALFHNVISFRDVSIVVEDEVEKIQAETLHRETPTGRKNVVVEGRVKEWRNADEPGAHAAQDQQFLQLPVQGYQPQYAPQVMPQPYPGFVPQPPGPVAPYIPPPGPVAP